MRSSESHNQPDLFAGTEEKPPLFGGYAYEDYMLEIRRPQIQELLKKVQDAKQFPWKNLTVATTEEMKFNGMARLFPKAEGIAYMEAFAAEIIRLYALIDEPWTPLYYSVLKKNYSF
jgi:hypothetical protein